MDRSYIIGPFFSTLVGCLPPLKLVGTILWRKSCLHKLCNSLNERKIFQLIYDKVYNLGELLFALRKWQIICNQFIILSFFFFLNLFIYLYLFLTVLGLRFCARAFSICGEQGPLFIAVRRPLTVAASPVAEHRLQTRRLSSCGSRA